MRMDRVRTGGVMGTCKSCWLTVRKQRSGNVFFLLAGATAQITHSLCTSWQTNDLELDFAMGTEIKQEVQERDNSLLLFLSLFLCVLDCSIGIRCGVGQQAADHHQSALL